MKKKAESCKSIYIIGIINYFLWYGMAKIKVIPPSLALQKNTMEMPRFSTR